MYVRVVVDTEAASYLDSFTYLVPEDMEGRVQIGSCVLAPFGSRNVTGYVVAIEDTTSLTKVKSALAVIDSPVRLSPESLDLAKWLSKRYLCGLSRAANSILPGVLQFKVRTTISADENAEESAVTSVIQDAGGSISYDSFRSCHPELVSDLKRLEKVGDVVRRYELIPPLGKAKRVASVELAICADRISDYCSALKSAPAQAKLLRYIAEHGTSTLADLAANAGVSASVASALVKKGLLRRTSLRVRRTPSHNPSPSTAHLELTSEQQSALDITTDLLDRGQHDVMLMHGVTASGKTEVYLRAIERAISHGHQSLALLPEIALTTQVLNIFRGRFGDRVAALHSMLSAGERYDEWMRVQDGEVDVVLGARSAVFAPLSNLGLVIVDEEHEPSYKQDSDPRYHGRDVAIRRATECNALTILGSATPSVESYYRALDGEYKLVTLQERVAGRPMPNVEVADLRDEYQRGRATIFTERLSEAISETLARRQQIILFQNRRAYATFLLCRECGYTAECPNCAVSLKLHAMERVLKCHHCEHEAEAPTTCPNCGGRKIGKFGIGTERIEEEVAQSFPEARTLRMDRDTTTRKGSHGSILEAFRRHDADILIGTQMVAKGLDFPGVTLVGVISADTSLNLPDFRAGERTFQLLSQVAGRAGRGVNPGEVIIQTFNPEHYAVQTAVAHDYATFFAHEIEQREQHRYPPFSSMINIVATDPDDAEAEKRLQKFVTELERRRTEVGAPVDILGPAPAPIARLRGDFRWHLLIRSKEEDTLVRMAKDILDALPSVRRGVSIDVDPMSII